MGVIIFIIGFFMNELYTSLQVGLVTNCAAIIVYIIKEFSID
jgi:hypothetical protein